MQQIKTDRVYLRVEGATGERLAMMLSEQIRNGCASYNQETTNIVYQLLDKIHKAISINEWGIFITPDEASEVIEIYNDYLTYASLAPFDVSWPTCIPAYPERQRLYPVTAKAKS